MIVDYLAIGLLAIAICSLLLKEIAAGIWSVAMQSMLLVLIGALVALGSGEADAWVGVVLTLLVKVVAIPLILRAALSRVRLKREIDPVLPDRLVLLLGVLVAALAYQLDAPLELSAAIALMLVGLLMMVVRRKALSQALGLVTLENGIYLAALTATEGLPLAVELAVAFDVLVGAIVLAIVAQRIGQTFQSTDVDRLRTLRDRPGRTLGRVDLP